MGKAGRRIHRISPAQVLALGFLIMILVGAGLLSLPIASTTGVRTPYLDALFTATSATCVTGLVVYDTYTHWSMFGQVVLMILIQIGGMGFITIALLIRMLSRRKIGLRQRFLMQESVGLPQMAGVLRTTGLILYFTALCEGAGALLLATQFVPKFGLARGLWYGLFHSISAFCNAGFDLMGIEQPFSSLTAWVDNPVVCLTIMVLIVIGGVGFVVWSDVSTHKLRMRRYSLQSKVILTTTLIMLVIPFLMFYYGEFGRPQWAFLTGAERFWGAAMHTVSPRTAGFNTLDYVNFSEVGLLLTILLMIIGGAPGSTAGGIKVTSAATIFLSVKSILSHRDDVEVYGRRLNSKALGQASVLLSLYAILTLGGAAIISVMDNVPLLSAAFEAASAVATVGLSTGLTPNLCNTSHLILIFLMYLGRIGGLTLLYALADPNVTTRVRLPEESIAIG